jgi:hypothetical protein
MQHPEQPFVVHQESPGLIMVELAGRLAPQQWYAALDGVAKLLPEGKRTSILVSGERFEGWSAGKWDDFSFQHDNDSRIGRMAIVADAKWEDQALMFAGKGLRKIEIEFFRPAEMGRARQWLTAAGS